MFAWALILLLLMPGQVIQLPNCLVVTDDEIQFIENIKADLQITKMTVICDSSDPRNPPARLVESDAGYGIIINPFQFKTLPDRIRKAVLAHEMGHVNRPDGIEPNSRESQIRADSIATRYVDPQDLIEMLTGFWNTESIKPDRDMQQRLVNLKEIQTELELLKTGK